MSQKNFIGIDYYKLAEDPDKYRYIVTEKCGPNEEEKGITCVLQKPCSSVFKSIFKIVKRRWDNSAENVIITMPPGARIEDRKHLIKEINDVGVEHPLIVSRTFAQTIEYFSGHRRDNSPVAIKSGWYPFKVQSVFTSDAFSHIASIAVRQNHISVSYVSLHEVNLLEDAFADAYYDIKISNTGNPAIESLKLCLEKIRKNSHVPNILIRNILISEEDLDEYKPFSYYSSGKLTNQHSGKKQIIDVLRSYYPVASLKQVSFLAAARGALLKHVSTLGMEQYPDVISTRSISPHKIWAVNDSFSKYKEIIPRWPNITTFGIALPTRIYNGEGRLFLYEGNNDEKNDFRRISEIRISVPDESDNTLVSVNVKIRLDANMIPKVINVFESSSSKEYSFTEINV